VFGRKRNKRLFVLSLDGVPFSFLRAGIAAGRFPNIAGLGTPVRMDSVLPPISSVAWASFSTGVNPGGHGIFGFVDRDPRTMAFKLPSARDLLVPTLWTRLNAAGKRAIVMNVPLTYPPQEIDGIMISGSCAPTSLVGCGQPRSSPGCVPSTTGSTPIRIWG